MITYFEKILNLKHLLWITLMCPRPLVKGDDVTVYRWWQILSQSQLLGAWLYYYCLISSFGFRHFFIYRISFFFKDPSFFWIRLLILFHVFTYNLLAKWNEILINLKLRVLVLFLNQFLTRDMYFFLFLKAPPVNLLGTLTQYLNLKQCIKMRWFVSRLWKASDDLKGLTFLFWCFLCELGQFSINCSKISRDNQRFCFLLCDWQRGERIRYHCRSSSSLAFSSAVT